MTESSMTTVHEEHRVLRELLIRLISLSTEGEGEGTLPVDELQKGLSLVLDYLNLVHPDPKGVHELTRERAESLARNIHDADTPSLHSSGGFRESIKDTALFDLRMQDWEENPVSSPPLEPTIPSLHPMRPHPDGSLRSEVEGRIHEFLAHPVERLEHSHEIHCAHLECGSTTELRTVGSPHQCYLLRAPADGWTMCEREPRLEDGGFVIPVQFFCPRHSPASREDLLRPVVPRLTGAVAVACPD